MPHDNPPRFKAHFVTTIEPISIRAFLIFVSNNNNDRIGIQSSTFHIYSTIPKNDGTWSTKRPGRNIVKITPPKAMKLATRIHITYARISIQTESIIYLITMKNLFVWRFARRESMLLRRALKKNEPVAKSHWHLEEPSKRSDDDVQTCHQNRSRCL